MYSNIMLVFMQNLKNTPLFKNGFPMMYSFIEHKEFDDAQRELYIKSAKYQTEHFRIIHCHKNVSSI